MSPPDDGTSTGDGDLNEHRGRSRDRRPAATTDGGRPEVDEEERAVVHGAVEDAILGVIGTLLSVG